MMSKQEWHVHNGNLLLDKNSLPSVAITKSLSSKFNRDERRVMEERKSSRSLSENSAPEKSKKIESRGFSLIDSFTPEQIMDHITGLQQSSEQINSKMVKHQNAEHQKEILCQLCLKGKLRYEPLPIYCIHCGIRIKLGETYYSTNEGVSNVCFCIACCKNSKGDIAGSDGLVYKKDEFIEQKNAKQAEERWIQCSKCKGWQHQVCALFNVKMSDSGLDYTCLLCCIAEMERGDLKPLAKCYTLGAKDLPRTHLSDHIEGRLFRRLKLERIQRAKQFDRKFEEGNGAEPLVVRVVSSVDKKVQVKPHFQKVVCDKAYPKEFPYRSKVILLFQKIDGVEVCLFGMYVQEYGADCPEPNKRHISLAYLDTVKYFTPNEKTISGESLRTFVYHEVLIGYLEYCKRRGFTSCYIWACPPLKGEDYIIYGHPETQQIPDCGKLREWYHTMLAKAMNEDIVLQVTRIHDYFFTSAEWESQLAATRLPYFDGDYWPGAIEDMILKLQFGDETCTKQQKNSNVESRLTNMMTKSKYNCRFPETSSEDYLLAKKLKQSTNRMKDDFIIVQLQYLCARCHQFILSGKIWICFDCNNYQICGKCYEEYYIPKEQDGHPLHNMDTHIFCQLVLDEIDVETKDEDGIIESAFFDTRQAFLSLCQGNHYQFDSLRRAKHSSMMILFHLHNPTAPSFVSTCNVCYNDITMGLGWRCETCHDYDICMSCYRSSEISGHPHTLISHPTVSGFKARKHKLKQRKVKQMQEVLDLLLHASSCHIPACLYRHCHKMKGLFHHSRSCKTRATGGCSYCKRIWHLLDLHGRSCLRSNCNVPWCREMRELIQAKRQIESRWMYRMKQPKALHPRKSG